MGFDLNQIICNPPSTSSSSHLFCDANKNQCNPCNCHTCCRAPFLNDYTYSILKKVCHKIIKNYDRQKCNEKYTVFDGGNSINPVGEGGEFGRDSQRKDGRIDLKANARQPNDADINGPGGKSKTPGKSSKGQDLGDKDFDGKKKGKRPVEERDEKNGITGGKGGKGHAGDKNRASLQSSDEKGTGDKKGNKANKGKQNVQDELDQKGTKADKKGRDGGERTSVTDKAKGKDDSGKKDKNGKGESGDGEKGGKGDKKGKDNTGGRVSETAVEKGVKKDKSGKRGSDTNGEQDAKGDKKDAGKNKDKKGSNPDVVKGGKDDKNIKESGGGKGAMKDKDLIDRNSKSGGTDSSGKNQQSKLISGKNGAEGQSSRSSKPSTAMKDKDAHDRHSKSGGTDGSGRKQHSKLILGKNGAGGKGSRSSRPSHGSGKHRSSRSKNGKIVQLTVEEVRMGKLGLNQRPSRGDQVRSCDFLRIHLEERDLSRCQPNTCCVPNVCTPGCVNFYC